MSDRGSGGGASKGFEGRGGDFRLLFEATRFENEEVERELLVDLTTNGSDSETSS